MKKGIDSVVEVMDSIDRTVGRIEKEFEAVIQPVQKTAFSRFPVLFMLAATFGVSCTIFAFERILMEITYVYERPLVMLIIGVGILTLTGTLYKKLS